MKYYIGIDVGWSGAVAIVPDKKKYRDILVYDMPPKESFNELYKYLISVPDVIYIVGVEKQHPFPKQGVVSVFSLGWQYGYICGLLDTLKIPYIEVEPREWLKHFKCAGKRSGGGKKLYKTARRLYPEVKLESERGIIKDGRVDALLIATYVKQLHP